MGIQGHHRGNDRADEACAPQQALAVSLAAAVSPVGQETISQPPARAAVALSGPLTVAPAPPLAVAAALSIGVACEGRRPVAAGWRGRRALGDDLIGFLWYSGESLCSMRVL